MKKILISNLFFTALLSSALAATDSAHCTDTLIEIERLGPVRNQGIAGLCFAFEGADLVTYKIGRRVSALDMALSYYNKGNVAKFTSVYASGGDTQDTITAALKTGLCSEEEIPSDEVMIGADEQPKIFSHFEWLEKNSWSKSEAYNRAADIFPKLSNIDFEKSKRAPTIKQKIKLLQKHACSERLNPSIELKNHSSTSKKQTLELIKIIDLQLNNNNVVGIGFDSNDLYAEEKDDGDNHATTLVGRRWSVQKNTCEYLMRDNFGEQCTLYQKHFECNKGYIWVSKEFLLKNMYEVEFIP